MADNILRTDHPQSQYSYISSHAVHIRIPVLLFRYSLSTLSYLILVLTRSDIQGMPTSYHCPQALQHLLFHRSLLENQSSHLQYQMVSETAPLLLVLFFHNLLDS